MLAGDLDDSTNHAFSNFLKPISINDLKIEHGVNAINIDYERVRNDLWRCFVNIN